MSGEELKKKIVEKKAKVGIIGMGYVGLPLAIGATIKGYEVVGFDIDKTKIDLLNEGKCYIKHISEKEMKRMVETDRFKATNDFNILKEMDLIILCVPTPLTEQREPDMSYIVNTCEEVGKHLKKGQIIILESTTYPGTTDELMKNILEKSGLKEGKDFFLAFSPEREDPGRKDFTTTSTPKVVGGVSSEGGELAQLFYSQFIEKVVPVKDARTAEASKLTENIFRAVNIALVNELKMIYDRMGIDIWEVLDAASTKPFGFMRFNPGPGWGGHCIPLDPFYLTWKAKEYGINSNFIEHAGEINRKMPEYVIEKLMLGLNERRKSIKDSKILVIGVAYKRDIDDPRESPAFEILTLLLKLGAKVDYYDPYIPILPKMREWRDIPQMKSITLSERKLKTFDATIIVTDHRCIDYENLKKNSSLIVDTRGVFKKGAGNIIKA